ncbi:MAG: tetratricopeptide repeat protein [Acidobacteriota bacterium]|nr:tetratricopeptide repeat protein [Acidobacteriota bacterium]MDH3529326.1 tetratricopeptide repeat protein [Acidobacteriota bacterium]
MVAIEQEWISGDVTLGTAANWSADEIRLVSELGYALAQQGRNAEAIAVFEGLSALAPATHYFDSALGALWLREANFVKSLKHLNAALESDPDDIPNRVNRAEALIHTGDPESAIKDLSRAIATETEGPLTEQCVVRATALLATLAGEK